MKRCFFITFIVALILFIHMRCLDPEPLTFDNFPLHLRNTSTTSGVYFGYERWYMLGYLPQGPEWVSVYLAKSPEPGAPVDTTIRLVRATSHWLVRRDIDNVVIDSGTVYFDCEKWLLIGTSSCTWSDNPLW